MAFSVLGLLGTVALRKTFLSWRTNAEVIQLKLAETGTEVTAETAKMVAKAIRAPMWEWHYLLALFLALSIVIRLVMVARDRSQFPLLQLINAPKEEKLKKAVHLLICMSLMVMTMSGGVVYYHELLGFTKEGVHWVKELHEYVMYAVLGLVVLHLGGVMMHELKTKEGIVSKMIHGDEEMETSY
jgi:cytochrome b561